MKEKENESFLKKFTECIEISKYDADSGKPGLLEGYLSDKRVIIKCWPTDNRIDSKIIEDIWRYEIRQLHRLKGLPGLGDFISSMIDSGRDSQGFYLVLDAGYKVPLSHILREKKTLSLNREWIKNTKPINNRLRLWENLSRIVRAITLLHSQGLLHRHLDKDSILTDPKESGPDFQLTGFEWSLRVHAISSLKNDYIINDRTKQYSFLSDWADLGYLILDLLKIDLSLFLDLSLPPNEIVNRTELTLNEVTLIRGLLGVMKLESNVPREAINGDLISDKILTIIKSLEQINSKFSYERLISFLFSLGNNAEVLPERKTSVFKAIQYYVIKKHGITLSENDTEECLDYIRKDLADYAYVTINKINNHLEEVLIVGNTITYVLEQKRNTRDDEEPGWDIAFCHSAYIEPPSFIRQKAKKYYLKNEFVNCSHFRKKHFNSTIPSKSWDDVMGYLNEDESDNISHKDIVDGFSIFHLTELAFAKSEIYPVSIINYDKERLDSRTYIVKLVCREDNQNALFSLNGKPAAIRLQDVLENERNNSINWILTDNQNLSEEDNSITLDYFSSTKNEEGIIEYTFSTNSPEPDFNNCFIIPASIQGTIRQLSRRASAIDELSNHAELRNMLSNPYIGTIVSDVPTKIHNSYDSLDESKQDAFKSINKTLPVYLVQGPPGVGKTFLITTLVNQIFLEEKESRVVLTAQSHATVQHLYQEVISSLKKSKFDPLVVSCIKKDREDDEDASVSQLDRLALSYINKLIESPLFLTSKSIAAKDTIIKSSKSNSISDRYSLIRQILKSANILFATSNSRHVEDLIKEKSQFDWSIMEETGKVTGIELLSPMLLSYRRLMIGDHKQLPPYASEKMREILSDATLLKKALLISLEVNNYSVKGEWIKERFNEDYINGLDANELEALSRSSLRLHQLFESLINEEENQLSKIKAFYGDESKHRKIASMLHFQHRMHPDIAELISFVFYDNKLKTSEDKSIFYRDAQLKIPFKFINESPLNNTPSIVWVDIPDVQKTRSNKVSESLPVWTNAIEKNTVLSILAQLCINDDVDKKPKLAIMSPYAKQVSLIAKGIDGEIKNGNSLDNLNDFLKPDDHSSFCSTVDGFQGAEADVVIVSMVRNNSHSYVRASLGFLLDSRRMNVLFSRAKFKLIIVGSFSFLEYWSEIINKIEVSKGNEENIFMIKLINKLKEYESIGLMKRINYKKINNK
ncbi:AAA domain-containing protein [Klebsiella pneumoniae]